MKPIKKDYNELNTQIFEIRIPQELGYLRDSLIKVALTYFDNTTKEFVSKEWRKHNDL
jgi:hypothetical protein